MFIDEAQIYVQGGNGGSGSVAFFPMKKGPCGGHGGKGGDVIVQGDPQMSDLHMYMGAKLFKAQDGGRGEKFCRTGSNGATLILRVPIGTSIMNAESEDFIEISDSSSQQTLATGGVGGRGNIAFVSSTNQVPRQAEPGEKAHCSMNLRMQTLKQQCMPLQLLSRI